MIPIKTAPGYSVDLEKKEIVNDKTGKTLSVRNNSVRMIVDGVRKAYRLGDLLAEAVKSVDEAKAKKEKESPAKKNPKAVGSTNKSVSQKLTERIAKRSQEEEKETPKKSQSKAKHHGKRIQKKAEKNKTKKSKSKAVYPYKIQRLDEINVEKTKFEKGHLVSFVDYKTKKTVKGVFVSHSNFGDGYPAGRISFTVDKKKKSKLISYLNLKHRK